MAGINGGNSPPVTSGRKHVEHWTCIILALLALANQLCAVKINSITVPASIQNGSNEVIHLDCEYDVSPDDTNLVIKWFLNDDPEPVYQWIPNLMKQASSDKYQEHVIVETQYSASTLNDYNYRALKIKHPTTELTGIYKCEVTSFESQDSKVSQMTVYAPPKKLNFYVSEAGPLEGVNVTCEAEGVFPLPQLRVYQIPRGGSKKFQLPGKKLLTNQSGVYDIRLISQLDETKEPMYFECELQINSTDYVQSERLQYLPAPPKDGNFATPVTTDDENDGANVNLFSLAVLWFGVLSSMVFTVL